MSQIDKDFMSGREDSGGDIPTELGRTGIQLGHRKEVRHGYGSHIEIVMVT